jgi:hypothetical protein
MAHAAGTSVIVYADASVIAPRRGWYAEIAFACLALEVHLQPRESLTNN